MIDESSKAAIAIKTARTALGISQQDFSEMMKVSKTTLARIETLDSQVKLDFYMRAIKIFNSYGVTVDAINSENIVITIDATAQQKFIDDMANVSNRRTDRKL